MKKRRPVRIITIIALAAARLLALSGGCSSGSAGSDPAAKAPEESRETAGEAFSGSRGYMSRNWTDYMRQPTGDEIDAVRGAGRSVYLAMYPRFPGVSRALEYCVDFHADHQPPGTYLCPLNWWMDVSALEARYASVYNDYTGTPGGYCGFQCLGDGSRVFIMTVWTTFCKDYDGNVYTFTPRVIYPEDQGQANRNMDEGSFVQCILPFAWETGRDYRVLLQQSTSEDTGNVVLSSWVCDLAEGSWQMLVSFDTGVSDTYLGQCGGFLENFLPEYTGEIRTMELWNLRGRSADTHAWVAADSVSFLVNGSQSPMDYVGSCNFGTDGSSIWAISSGVSGLCETPSDSDPYLLTAGDTGDPY